MTADLQARACHTKGCEECDRCPDLALQAFRVAHEKQASCLEACILMWVCVVMIGVSQQHSDWDAAK